MMGFNLRWVCGCIRRTRKLWVVVILAAILLLLGKNFRSNQTMDDYNDDDDDRSLSVDDGKNRYPMNKFVDLSKDFDEMRQSSVLTPSSVDLRQAFDSRRPSGQIVVKKSHYPVDSRKTSVRKMNESVLNTVSDDLKKAFEDKKMNSEPKSVDLKKAFEDKNNEPGVKSVDPKKADKNNDSGLKSVELKKAFDDKINDSGLKSGDPQKAFEDRNNNPGLKSVDLKKAFGDKNNEPLIKSADLKKAFDSKGNNSKTLFTDRPKASSSVTNKTITKARRLTDEELPKAFAAKLTGQEKAIVFQILQALDTVSIQLQLPYFLCGGTLLGSFRHHDLIPWDDDIDVYMNITERDSVYSALASLSPTFEVFAAGHRLKLYSHWSRSSSHYPWMYPYVDINFFYENATHIIDTDPIFDVMAYRKETIFPLHRRPLGGLFPFAPHDTYSYLTNTYLNLSLCSTSHYNHRAEKVYEDAGAVVVVMCRRLRTLFPFVYRTRDPDSQGVRETLRISETELHSMIVDEPQYVVGDLFGLLTDVNETRNTTRNRSDGL